MVTLIRAGIICDSSSRVFALSNWGKRVLKYASIWGCQVYNCLSFCIVIIVSMALKAGTSAPSILRELDDDILVNIISRTDSSSDLAQQHAALLHEVLAQEGILCKEQLRQVNAFCARVKKSELSPSVKHQLISSLRSLVRHPRRKWIIALSLIGVMIGCVGIGMIVAKMSQNVSKRTAPAAAQVRFIDVTDPRVNPFVRDGLVHDIYVVPDAATEIGHEAHQLAAQTPRRVAAYSGPPGGSPGMGQGKNDPTYTPLFYRQWQMFLGSKTFKEINDPMFTVGYRALIDAYDKGLLTQELHDSIIDKYFAE